ncbi:hypothetical protein AB0F15_16295 [Amycolatopsis sp. NPDC026612]|uniref:DUF4760 domain-containing protein n=1 Tax=Amycolatopsis sp. NPDC026612 TaxID=3155466 RepID=UPI0033EF289D
MSLLQLAGAIAPIISSLIVMISVGIATLQFRLANRARLAEALNKMFQEFHSPQACSDRDTVLESTANASTSLSTEERKAFGSVIELHERVALLARRGLVPIGILLDMYSGLYVRSWDKLEWYVGDFRVTTDLVNYGENFEHVAGVAREYRRQNFKAAEQSNDLKG